MNSGQIFVVFGIPAIALAMAYIAMCANEWAIRCGERLPPGE